MAKPFPWISNKPIFSWVEVSKSNGTTQYTTKLYDNGDFSCDCPGWVMAKKDKKTGTYKERECKHTVKNARVGAEYFAKHKKGEKLPQQMSMVTVGASESVDVTSNKRSINLENNII